MKKISTTWIWLGFFVCGEVIGVKIGSLGEMDILVEGEIGKDSV